MGEIDWTWLLFSFEGRINRAKFWLGVGTMWVVSAIIWGIAGVVNSGFMWFVATIVFLLIIWPSLAIAIKRWHDRNKSGWWVLIGLIPIIGPIWVWVECGFLPGTVGPNMYGLDPLGPVAG